MKRANSSEQQTNAGRIELGRKYDTDRCSGNTGRVVDKRNKIPIGLDVEQQATNGGEQQLLRLKA